MSEAADAPDIAAIPAATLILWRDGPPAELLMIERAATMAFAAGATVFPGGRVDPADRALAARLGGGDLDEGAAKVAAIRETIEEVGLAIAVEPAPEAAALARWRDALAGGAALAALLDEGGHRLVPETLVPFARWCPRSPRARVYDTRFFIAHAPAGARPLVDGGETVRAAWATPAAILGDAAAGRRHVIFPTARNLERLATLADFAAAERHLADFPVRLISPHRETRDDGEWLCIPDGLGYPVLGEPMARVRRG